MYSKRPFDRSDLGLRGTLARLGAAANRDEPAPASPAEWADRRNAALTQLYDKIKSLYLLEFLIFDVIRIEHVGDTFLAAGGLVIAVGAHSVRLTPSVDPSDAALLAVEMRNPRHDDDVRLLHCDVGQAPCQWTIVKAERGLRKALRSYLPVKRQVLDEALFQDALNAAMLGPQPLFAIGSDDLRAGLGGLLDFVTSDELRRSLSLGVRKSALQLAHAAPVVRTSALKMLPTLNRSMLLLAPPRQPSAADGDEAAQPQPKSAPPGELR